MNPTRSAPQRVATHARPLTGHYPDYDQLVEAIGDARIVLLGESTHGTHEFYHERARITRRLIEEMGFTVVAVEADWPDAAQIDHFIHQGFVRIDEAFPRVFRFVLRHSGDARLAEELTQDALITALERMPSYRGESALTSWVLGIARHLLTRRHSVDARLLRFEDEVEIETLLASLVALDGPEQQLAREQLVLRVHGVLDRLQDRLRSVLKLVELEEGVRMVGELLDADPEDVKIGAPVEVAWVRVDDDLTIPAWRLS